MNNQQLEQLSINTIRTAIHRCGTAGEIGSSWYTDGVGSTRVYHLESRHEFRSERPDLAES